ncbi:MAG: hypothetical protein ACI9WO_002135 [Sphingobacteriales bacterium]|jgi:hypothetical protein
MNSTILQQVTEISWTSQALKDFGNRNLSVNFIYVEVKVLEVAPSIAANPLSQSSHR